MLKEVTKIERQEGEKWPEPRDFHAACCLGYGTEYAQLLISGGHGGGNKVLKDAWLFGVSSRCWKEVSVSYAIKCQQSICILLWNETLHYV